MNEYFFGLPYIDPMTGQPAGFGSYIVPVDWEQPRIGTPTEAPSRMPTSAQSYEEPWYVDTINRAIERAAQVATVNAAGYPPYPQYPAQTAQPAPVPTVAQAPGVTPQPQREGIQLSQGTLMLIVGGALLFMLGSKRGR